MNLPKNLPESFLTWKSFFVDLILTLPGCPNSGRIKLD